MGRAAVTREFEVPKTVVASAARVATSLPVSALGTKRKPYCLGKPKVVAIATFS